MTENTFILIVIAVVGLVVVGRMVNALLRSAMRTLGCLVPVAVLAFLLYITGIIH